MSQQLLLHVHTVNGLMWFLAVLGLLLAAVAGMWPEKDKGLLMAIGVWLGGIVLNVAAGSASLTRPPLFFTVIFATVMIVLGYALGLLLGQFLKKALPE